MSANTDVENTNELNDEQIRLQAREARRVAMRKQKLRQIWLRRIMAVIAPILFVLMVFFGGRAIVNGVKAHKAKAEAQRLEEIQNEINSNAPKTEFIVTEPKVDEEVDPYADSEYGAYANQYSEEKGLFFEGYEVNSAGAAEYISSEDVLSNYAVLLDVDDGHVIATKAGTTRINPASMTKILTVLVAAEHVVDLNDKFRIDPAITSYVWSNDCSAVGFANNEVVTVRDLMYGTILPSGGDAAMALAEYVAGSDELFVDMLNDKLEELGISETTHFTNCVGIYNPDHYSTMTDMAIIMKAAVENELAKEILKTHTYTTSKTEEHPDGITVSNWFLRRIEDKDSHGEVMCAKTGFVNQSGCCAASYMIGNDGKHYICVTADAWSSWRCIYDHVAIYDMYVPE